MLRLLALLALLALFAAGLCATASAAPSMQVGVADDRQLLGSAESAERVVRDWERRGVDAVRIVVRWGAYAPDPDARTAPEGFDAADPDDPRYAWGALDRAIDLVSGAGMSVTLTVTGWGPVWGTEFPVKRNPRYKPDPDDFAAFATAVAKRYGTKVDRYILWNEPNQPQWLQPQSECTRTRCEPFAPHHYRRIVRAAEPAIRRADPGAVVAFGSLAPSGESGASANAKLKPLVFMRAFGCVSAKYKKTRSKACRRFKPASGSLFAYHPHSLKLAPSRSDRDRDNAALADLGRLTRALDRIARAGGFRVRGGGRIGLLLDEWAYQTNPPDKTLGVSTRQQSRYLQQGSAIASMNPRVRGLYWYVWKDEPLGDRQQGWQSGLQFLSGKAKPALAAFARPFWAWKVKRGTAGLWGQVRPGGAHDVTIERRSGSASWKRVAAVRTDRHGVFRRTVRIASKTTFRFRWAGGVSDARTVSR